jgi:hypothetical protein
MEKVPKFKNAQEEGEFWETHSPLDFPDEFEEVREPIIDRRSRRGVARESCKKRNVPPPN